MRILVDLDGTIAHFDRELDRHLDERYSHLPNIPRSPDQLSFNLWEGRTEEEQQALREIMNWPGFYRHLEVMEGAVEAIKEMEAEGHEVRFLTAPWESNNTCLQDKQDWIAEHFGEEYRRKLFYAKDKDWVAGDILFDDKYPIPHAETASWVQVFITQPYNRDAPGLRIASIRDWRDGVAEVEKLHRTWQEEVWHLFEKHGAQL
jgi:5'(3')-deoxyribonucleotidase